jgi:hypothetical protein
MRCSSQRHQRMVHPKQRLQRLEGIRVLVVGPRKTYVLPRTAPLFLLTSGSEAGSGKSVLTYVAPNDLFDLPIYVIAYSPVLQSSRTSMAHPTATLAQHMRPTFFSTSAIRKNRMLALCLPLSSSSSLTNLTLSPTFFLLFTRHTILAPSSPVIVLLHNASRTFSKPPNKSQRISL